MSTTPNYRRVSLVGSMAMALAIGVASTGWAQDASFPPPTGDPSIIPEGAKLELLFDDACFIGGVAVAPEGQVYFSDITFSSGCRHGESELPQAGVIWRYDPNTGETAVFRSPSGMSNGLKFDGSGNLVAAEGADFGGRRVTITDMKTGRARVLAAIYDGHPLNAPNDLAVDAQGRVYFTDPRYLGHESVEQPTMAVYRADPDGTVTRIISDAGKPNGVLVSVDQKTLYVGANDNGALDFTRLREGEATERGRMLIWAYDLAPDGTASNRRVFVNYEPHDSADGLTTDTNGNVYAAARRADAPGIYVYNSDGKELASIPTGEILPSNVGFGHGPDANVLYVTAGGELYRIRLNSEGYQLPEN